MKLHTFDWEFPMAQAHDDARAILIASPCADFEIAGQPSSATISE